MPSSPAASALLPRRHGHDARHTVELPRGEADLGRRDRGTRRPRRPDRRDQRRRLPADLHRPPLATAPAARRHRQQRQPGAATLVAAESRDARGSLRRGPLPRVDRRHAHHPRLKRSPHPVGHQWQTCCDGGAERRLTRLSARLGRPIMPESCGARIDATPGTVPRALPVSRSSERAFIFLHGHRPAAALGLGTA